MYAERVITVYFVFCMLISGSLEWLRHSPEEFPHYKLRFGDCPMDDIKQITNTNVTVCKKACDELKECRAFLFVNTAAVRWLRRRHKPYCWLKHKTCKELQQQSQSAFHYYDKFVTFSNYTKRMRGCSSPTVASIFNVSVDICKEACDEKDKCKAFVFNDNKGNKAVKNGGTSCDFKTDYCSSITYTFNHSFVYTKVTPRVIRPVPNIDCIFKSMEKFGAHYIGKQNVSNGVNCLRWDKLQGMRPYTRRGFFHGRLPDFSLHDAANYCRMPFPNRRGPYCYIQVDATVEKKVACNIPVCEFGNSTSEIYSSWTEEINVDCLSGSLGADYIGTVNVTKSGRPCKRWTLVKNVTAKNFPDVSVDAAASYCRNPFLHHDGPWCFLNDELTEWERCDIKMCPHIVNETNCKHTTIGEDFQGGQSSTISGKRCHTWSMVLDQNGRKLFPGGRGLPQYRLYSGGCLNPDHSISGPWCYFGGKYNGNGYVNVTRESCDVDYCAGFIPQWIFYKNDKQDEKPQSGKQKEGKDQRSIIWLVAPVASLVAIASIVLLLVYLRKAERLRNPFVSRRQHKRFRSDDVDARYDVTISGLDEQPL